MVTITIGKDKQKLKCKYLEMYGKVRKFSVSENNMEIYSYEFYQEITSKTSISNHLISFVCLTIYKY